MDRGEAEKWIDARLGAIAVRAQIDGKWDSFFLSELPADALAAQRERLVERLLAGIPVIALKEVDGVRYP